MFKTFLISLTGALAVVALSGTASAGSEPIRISGTGSATGGMQLVADAFMRAHPTTKVVVLPALGSAGGISALLAGRLDIAVANRPPNAKERAETLDAREYARTPFVLAVARKTGVTEISSAALAKLYADPMATYFNGQRARPILRLADASDTSLIKSINPAVAAAIDEAAGRRGMLAATTDSEAADLIDKTPGGFGPSTLAQILSEKRPLVALTIDGKIPTIAALERGAYPLAKSLFIIHRKDASPQVQAFLKYLQGMDARQLLAAHGHLMR